MRTNFVGAMIMLVMWAIGFASAIVVFGFDDPPPPIVYAPPPESDCYVHRTDAGWQERIPTDMCWASLVGHLFVDQERSSRVLTTIELGTAP